MVLELDLWSPGGSRAEIVPRSGDNVNRINGLVIGNNDYDLPFSQPFSVGSPGYKIDIVDERAAGFKSIMPGRNSCLPVRSALWSLYSPVFL